MKTTVEVVMILTLLSCAFASPLGGGGDCPDVLDPSATCTGCSPHCVIQCPPTDCSHLSCARGWVASQCPCDCTDCHCVQHR